MVPTALVKKAGFFGIGLIILVGAFLRLYHISDYMTFLGDEGRDATIVRDILLGNNFPLIGPGTSVGNMYLGPIYYYLISPALLLADFSPVGPAIFVAVIGILTIALLWWVSRKWGMDSFTSLMVSSLYAVSPVVITYSRSSWNPNIMPFFSLLCIYGIWRVWRKSDWPWLIITTVSFSFVLNSHYLGLLLAPTLGLFWLFTRHKSLKFSLLSLFIFLFLFSPIVIFDSRHHWTNFNSLKNFLTDRQQTVNFKAYKAVPNLWPIWSDINTSLLTAGNKKLGSVVSLIFILTLTLTVAKIRKQKELLLVLTWIVIGVIGLGLYKQHIYAHYYGFLFPAPFILLGLLIKNTGKIFRFFLYILAFCLLIINLINNSFRHEPNRQLSRTREIAEFIDKQSAGEPYNLALISKHNYDASYRYFLSLIDSPYYPVQQKPTSQLFVICENSECQPINSPLYEIAAFGWSKIDSQWPFPWQVTVYKLVPNPAGV